jgi:hypothetical protein
MAAPESTPATTPATSATASAPTSAIAKKKGAGRFITPALVLVAVLGIGIFGGVLIGQNTASSSQAAGPGQGGQTAPGGGTGGTAPDGATGGMGGFTSGTIVSVEGTTIVLETSDGEQVTVNTSDDTSVTTAEESDVASLATGDTLTVVGEADDAGDVTASTITEGATTGFGGMGGGPQSGTDDSTETGTDTE